MCLSSGHYNKVPYRLGDLNNRYLLLTDQNVQDQGASRLGCW